MTPRVSMVVAIHDVRPWLEDCLDSVLAQTEADIEIVAVDDGSTDGSGDICDAYAAADPRFRVVHQRNAGLSGARNAGLDIARGEWVMFLDGDDWVEAGMIEAMLAAAEDRGADVVMAGCYVDHHHVDGSLVRTDLQVMQPIWIDPRSPDSPAATPQLVNLMGYAWNKLYRREFLWRNDLTFTAGLSLVEDAVFNAAVFTSGARVQIVASAFVHYVQRPRPTLGTSFRPDDLHLLLDSVRSKSSVLRFWGCPEVEVQLMESNLAVDALTGPIRVIATDPQIDDRSKRQRARQVLLSKDARDLLDLMGSPRDVDPRRRVLMTLLRRRRVRLLLLLLSMWHRRLASREDR